MNILVRNPLKITGKIQDLDHDGNLIDKWNNLLGSIIYYLRIILVLEGLIEAILLPYLSFFFLKNSSIFYLFDDESSDNKVESNQQKLFFKQINDFFNDSKLTKMGLN